MVFLFGFFGKPSKTMFWPKINRKDGWNYELYLNCFSINYEISFQSSIYSFCYCFLFLYLIIFRFIAIIWFDGAILFSSNGCNAILSSICVFPSRFIDRLLRSSTDQSIDHQFLDHTHTTLKPINNQICSI